MFRTIQIQISAADYDSAQQVLKNGGRRPQVTVLENPGTVPVRRCSVVIDDQILKTVFAAREGL